MSKTPAPRMNPHDKLQPSHLFLTGPSSPYLPPSRPWERKDPSSLWPFLEPEPFSCPLARREAPGKQMRQEAISYLQHGRGVRTMSFSPCT